MGNDGIGLSQLDLDLTFKVQLSTVLIRCLVSLNPRGTRGARAAVNCQLSTVNLITIQSDNQSREQ